jgi:hypothetical protein
MTANNTCQTTSTGTSNSITMSISQPSVGGTVASDQSVLSGGNASTINLTGNTGSVTKWQRSTVLDFSTFTDVPNTTTSVSGASMGGITETIYYRAVVQNGTCPSVNSSSVKITMVAGLPIELLYFKGDPHITYNKLYWVTATENNNDYFNIYRSADGVYFNNIFTIKGAGNSTHNLYYEVIDRSFDPVINYYVLRQTDFDGKWKESEIISVDNRGESAPILLKVTNLIGQEVGDDATGALLYHYSDGTILKRIH